MASSSGLGSGSGSGGVPSAWGGVPSAWGAVPSTNANASGTPAPPAVSPRGAPSPSISSPCAAESTFAVGLLLFLVWTTIATNLKPLEAAQVSSFAFFFFFLSFGSGPRFFLSFFPLPRPDFARAQVEHEDRGGSHGQHMAKDEGGALV